MEWLVRDRISSILERVWRVYFSNENKFCFANLNQLFVFDYLIYIDVDNPVYIDFAYTSDPRVFEVLIYWVDIESHSSRPERILMIDASSSEFMFEWRKWDFYIFPIDWCENQSCIGFIVVIWPQKSDFCICIKIINLKR